MEDDPEFGNFNVNKMTDKNQVIKQGDDDYIEDNFDQFRQIELENTKKV